MWKSELCNLKNPRLKKMKEKNKYTISRIRSLCVYWIVGSNKSFANDDATSICFASICIREAINVGWCCVVCAISQEVTLSPAAMTWNSQKKKRLNAKFSMIWKLDIFFRI